MSRRPIIYISGKITGNKTYKEDFAGAELFLREKGFNVINPCTACELDFFGYEDFMRVDFALIDVADAVFMLSNYSKSPGAFRELNYAIAKRKTVLYQNDPELENQLTKLQNQKWHYPSKGELPGKDQRILFLLKEPYFGERLFLGSRFQFDGDFYVWQCCGDEHWTDDMVFAWRYPPELPEL